MGALAIVATIRRFAGAVRSAVRASSPRRRRAMGMAALVFVAPVVALVLGAALTPLPDELRRPDRYGPSLRVLDRDGVLLREVRADDATRARWIALGEVGDETVRAVLAAEDQRFFQHRGVDPLAVVRAAGQAVWNRRVVSGASTLTMQLARLVRPHRRNLWGKLGEMALALRIEASLSKREILEEYINRAPFGPGLRGIAAGAAQWLDKPASRLSWAEAATLAAIPRGPAVYDVGRHPERVRARRDRILLRMSKARWISGEALALALAEPLVPRLGKGGFGAPHFVEAVVRGALVPELGDLRGRAEAVTTTLDADLQREAEVAAAATVRTLRKKHVSAASVVVLDNATNEILAYVGSPDAFDKQALGANDGARALRQPGSTLKPFVYGLAMDRLGFDGATLLADVETQLPVATGSYVPRNYDERFHGPVRLREALGNSYNVPAVRVAAELGPFTVLEGLHAAGLRSLTETPEHYGPAIALGDGEVTLLELASAYAGLARGGVLQAPRAVRALTGPAAPAIPEPAAPTRFLSSATAAMLTDILQDRSARVSAFGLASALDLPFPVAAKTGTSKGFRDNWTVGYTGEVTVAVWVGNFDGSPMEGTSGVTGAGPLFHAVMEAAMRRRPRGAEAADLRAVAAKADLVSTRVCALSGAAATSACPHTVDEWRRPGAPDAPCTMHIRMAIDRRTGLRASSRCPAEHVEERTFEEPGPLFAAWARSAKRPVPPRLFSPLCPERAGAPEATAALRIAHPRSGARYLLDAHRARGAQQLLVRIEAPASVGAVELRVDGRRVTRAGPPFVAEWPLEPGDHELVAEAAGLPPSEPVRVRVE